MAYDVYKVFQLEDPVTYFTTLREKVARCGEGNDVEIWIPGAPIEHDYELDSPMYDHFTITKIKANRPYPYEHGFLSEKVEFYAEWTQELASTERQADGKGFGERVEIGGDSPPCGW